MIIKLKGREGAALHFRVPWKRAPGQVMWNHDLYGYAPEPGSDLATYILLPQVRQIHGHWHCQPPEKVEP